MNLRREERKELSTDAEGRLPLAVSLVPTLICTRSDCEKPEGSLALISKTLFHNGAKTAAPLGDPDPDSRRASRGNKSSLTLSRLVCASDDVCCNARRRSDSRTGAGEDEDEDGEEPSLSRPSRKKAFSAAGTEVDEVVISRAMRRRWGWWEYWSFEPLISRAPPGCYLVVLDSRVPSASIRTDAAA